LDQDIRHSDDAAWQSFYGALSTRIRNQLDHENIKSIDDLCELSEAAFLRIPNLGLKSYFAIRRALANVGRSLNGMSNRETHKACPCCGKPF
jgi:DNA-directed RNA polymerase alpha subunit